MKEGYLHIVDFIVVPSNAPLQTGTTSQFARNASLHWTDVSTGITKIVQNFSCADNLSCAVLLQLKPRFYLLLMKPAGCNS